MSRIPVTCPTCGRVRHLRPCDARKARRCRHCHLQAIAPLGFQAAVAKYGRFFAIDKARAWRIDHPSTLEQAVESALAQIPAIQWEREYEVISGDDQKWFVDFLVYTPRGRVALEVQGEWVHTQSRSAATIQIRTRHLRACFDRLIFLSEALVRAADFADRLPHLLDLNSDYPYTRNMTNETAANRRQ